MGIQSVRNIVGIKTLFFDHILAMNFYPPFCDKG